MKRILLFVVFVLLLLAVFAGCSRSGGFREPFVCETPAYEPIDFAIEGAFVTRIDLIGLPKEGVKAAAWDDYDIKLRVFYDDNRLIDYPLKMVNIPVEMRHYFGEVGEHRINFVEFRYINGFDIKIINNPDWDGYVCKYYDRDKNLLYSEKVGFYGTSEYKGRELPKEEEDDDYLYRFTGWGFETENIHQDMQFVATYDKLEKRYYPEGPYIKSYVPIAGTVDEAGRHGSALIYLGRVHRVAAIHGDAVELTDADVELTLPQGGFDFPSFFREYTENVVGYSVKYVNLPEYNQHIYGHAAEIVSLANFAESFPSSYGYDWDQHAFLETRRDVIISRKDPFETAYRRVVSFLNNRETVAAGDNAPGFYRLAVVGSFDVYVSVPFNRIAADQYEIGAYSEFLIAPLTDTFRYTVQYSEDGEFGSYSDRKLELTTEGLYNCARAIDWGKWTEE